MGYRNLTAACAFFVLVALVSMASAGPVDLQEKEKTTVQSVVVVENTVAVTVGNSSNSAQLVTVKVEAMLADGSSATGLQSVVVDAKSQSTAVVTFGAPVLQEMVWLIGDDRDPF